MVVGSDVWLITEIMLRGGKLAAKRNVWMRYDRNQETEE
jgi:hypothetical protein